MKRMYQDELDWREGRPVTTRCRIEGCPAPLVCVDTPAGEATELAQQHRIEHHPHLPVVTPAVKKPKPVKVPRERRTGALVSNRPRMATRSRSRICTPERVQLALSLHAQGWSLRRIAVEHMVEWGSASEASLANSLSVAFKQAGHPVRPQGGRSRRGRLVDPLVDAGWRIYSANVSMLQLARLAAPVWGYSVDGLEEGLRIAFKSRGLHVRGRIEAKAAAREIPELSRGECLALVEEVASASPRVQGMAPPSDTATVSTADELPVSSVLVAAG